MSAHADNELRIFLPGYLSPSSDIPPQPEIERRPVVRISRYAFDILAHETLIASIDRLLDRLVISRAIPGRSDTDIILQLSQHRVTAIEEIGTEILVIYPETKPLCR